MARVRVMRVMRVVRVVRQARVRARHVRVVVARLPRRPRVAPRQRPALADHYVVVASMSLCVPITIHTLIKLLQCTPYYVL